MMIKINRLVFLILLTVNPSTLQANGLESEDIEVKGLKPFIIGGQTVDANILPWQVKVTSQFYQNGTLIGAGDCGGSIIASRWIVSAAHCFNVDGMGIRDQRDVMITVFRGTAQNFAAAKVIVNPNWNGDFTQGNDIALVQLTQDLPENSIIQVATPAQYAQAQTDFALTWSNTTRRQPNVIASGYGLLASGNEPSIADLQYVWLSGVPVASQTCTDFDGNGTPDIASNRLVCTSSPDPTQFKDTCDGDSGGPLVWQNPANRADPDFGMRLIGVTSFGADNCKVLNSQSGYSNLSFYYDWVNQQLVENEALALNRQPVSLLVFDPELLPDTTGNTNLDDVLIPSFRVSSGGQFHYFYTLLILSLICFRLKNKK